MDIVVKTKMNKTRITIIGLLIIVFLEGLVIIRLSTMPTDEMVRGKISLPLFSFSDVTFSDLSTGERADTPEKRRVKIQEWKKFETDTGYEWQDFGLVTAEGTWMSDTSLANDFNTVKIQCWKEFNHCFLSQAEIDNSFTVDPYLYLGTEIYAIKQWGFDEIRATSGTGLGCFEYELVIDRINETVSSIRKKVENDGLCEGMSDKPLLIYLSDQLRESQD